MILHHWDTDGICSASLLMDRFGKDENFTPKIGNYFLDEDDLNALKGHDRIIVADMNLANASEICKFAELTIYDHHIAKRVECAKAHINPYLEGKTYPSATLVIYENLKLPLDHRVVLGMVGDVGRKIFERPERDIVELYLRESGRTFEELEKASLLLDSSYKMFKRSEVLENVFIAHDLDEILESDRLNENNEILEKEIEEMVSKAEDIGNIMVLRMRTEHHIISAVARKMAWGMGKTALVLNEKSDRDEIYLRSPDKDVSRFIDMAKSRGYNAGGKREVVGVVLPKGEGKAFFNEIMEELR